MGDAMDRARAARNVLERLGKKVPGFAGYLDRELTREIDQLVRAHLANSLDAARASVAAYTRTLHLGATGRLERLGSLEKDLDALANGVRHAGSGYAGLFDALKVGHEQLEAVYHLEITLVEDVEAVAEAAEKLAGDEDALDGLSEALEKVRVRFEGRDQALKGVLVSRRFRGGGAMSQFLEVLEHYDPTGREIAFRVPPEGSAEIKFGAQLVVHEAQEAVFYRDGRALDVFAPGRHTLTTQNIPVLTKVLSLPFGFTSPFRVQVVFVSKRTFLDQKWGTREPVVFRDRELGVVRLRAFGTYGYRIHDSRTFVNTVVGSLGEFDTARLEDFYRDMIVARLNDLLGESLTSILDLPARYDELATLAKARLTEDFSKYGVDLSDFYINSVTPPDEVLARLDERASMGAVGDLSAYTRFKVAVALGDAARADGGAGGAAAAGMGVGLGAGFGVQMAGALSEAIKAGAAGGGAAAGTTTCARCGNPLPAGSRFCPTCGVPMAMSPCPRCRQPVPPGAKFCPACGAPMAPGTSPTTG